MEAVLDWGLNPGHPALEASTLPLGYRGGSTLPLGYRGGGGGSHCFLKQVNLSLVRVGSMNRFERDLTIKLKWFATCILSYLFIFVSNLHIR